MTHSDRAFPMHSKHFFLLTLLVLAQLGCDGKKSAVGSDRAVGSIVVDAALPEDGVAAGAAKTQKSVLTQGRFRVSGEGMTPIDTTVAAQNNRLVGRLDGIPVGQRTVELFLLDAGDTPLWRSSATVQVAANTQTTATLVLERAGDQAPQGSIQLASSTAQADSVFGVTATVSDLHDADESLEVRWDFYYDGEFDESEWLTTRAAENTYSVSGQVTVALQVRDRSGNVSTYTADVEVVRTAVALVFADAGLEAAVRRAVGRETGEILPNDVDELTELVASEAGITDLAGLERLASLAILDLSANQVSDLTPLAGLDGLVVLDLSENQISDLSPLAGLERLIDLRLSRNRVADLSPLAGLNQLIDLDLSGNRLVDLSPLAGLARLAELDLDSNQIADLGALLALERLESVDVQFNPPFAAAVYTEQIPALVSKGVRVDFNSLPVASAGPDQEVVTGNTAQLDGGGSSDPDGDELSYAWTQVAGPEVALSDAASARPTFGVPAAGTYLFALVVSDGPAESDPDTVSVLAPDRVPLADAGTDQGVEVGATVQLDGGGSSDPDGAALTYAWTQVAGATVALDDPAAARPSFVAAAAGTYTFTLVVNDGALSSAVDAVTVTAAVGNLAPIADAGADLQVQFGARVQLNGSSSNDPEGAELTYRWTAPDGIGLSSSTVARPSFDADVAGALAFVLRVNDGETDSTPDTVVVSVQPNSLPVVSISSPANGSSFLEGRAVALSGTAVDAEDGALAGSALQWASDIDGVLGGGNALQVSSLSPGSHTLSLLAADSQLDIGSASVAVTIEANTPPVADAGEDRQARQGDTVLLNGNGSSDANGDDLSYRWTQTGGPAVDLINDDGVRPAFTAEAVGVYTFELVVGDGFSQSAADAVEIAVEVEVVFADANLEAAVRAAMDKPSGDILASEAAAVEVLEAVGGGIVRLDGLEYFTGLITLGLQENPVADLAPLAGLTQLQELLMWNSGTGDLTPLAGLTQLHTLWVGGSQVSDLTPLAGLSQLANLNFNENQISDISALADMPNLTLAFFNNNQISDLAPLVANAGVGEGDQVELLGNPLNIAAYTQHIPVLEARGAGVRSDPPPPVVFADANLEAAVRAEMNKPSGDILVTEAASVDGLEAAGLGIARIDGLEHFTALEFLDLRSNDIRDISPLAGLDRLFWLGLDHNPIGDFSPLAGLRSLETLYLVNNGTVDIAPLAGLTRLQVLWVAAAGLEDLRPLAGLTQLQELVLFENSITDLTPLLDNTGLGEGDSVDLTDNILDDNAVNAQIPELEARGVSVIYSRREPQPGDQLTVELAGGVTMDFVWIGPGTFVMGSPDSEEGRRPAGEGPQHEVTLTQGYWLGKHEITQAQWEAVMGTRPWVGQEFAVPSEPSHPAVFVSWHDMQDFVARLNESAGQTLYRLPTEAEWEYACRAGTTTPWSWGADAGAAGDYAWYGPNAFQTGESWGHPVGTKLPNPWGLHDMHGNVWEWVQDRYSDGYYAQSPAVDPQGPEVGDFGLHTARGGDFFQAATHLRSAGRGLLDPETAGPSQGARLVRVQ